MKTAAEAYQEQEEAAAKAKALAESGEHEAGDGQAVGEAAVHGEAPPEKKAKKAKK